MPQRFRDSTSLCALAAAITIGVVVARPIPDVADLARPERLAAQGRSGWTVVASDTDVDLHSVWALSPRNVWAVGDAGTVLHWGGSGWDAWRPPAVDPVVSLNAIAMLGDADGWAQDGWAVGDGGAIYRWDGWSWAPVPSPTRAILTSLAMVSRTDGWAVGWNGAILHWDGIRWSLDPTAIAEGEVLASVTLSASDDGWAVGWGSTILHWDGASWSRQRSPVSGDLTSVAAVSRDEAWAVGAGGVILQWDGETWSAVQSPTEEDLNAVDVASGAGGWAVGQGGTVLRWDGRAWTEVTSPTEADLAAVAAMSEAEGCIVGRGGTILHRGTLAPTATPTRTSTSTRTPRPTSTITLTPTPGPSPTPSPTPTCPGDLTARLELQVVPPTALRGQQVAARFRSENFGIAMLWITVGKDGQDPIRHQWAGGFTSAVDVAFAAPSAPGRWTVSASGYGEVTACLNGQRIYTYGGASAHPSTLTVGPVTLSIPFAAVAAPRPYVTPAGSTAPTGSATVPTATPTTQPTRAVPTAPTRPPLYPIPTPVVAGSLPIDCLEIAAADAAALDGEYMIAPAGRVFRVYCHGMPGTPREYLPLASVGTGVNYASYRAGGYSNGTDVVSRYSRVRLDPATLVVDTSDQLHASSTGLLIHGSDRVTSMPFGVAMSCGTETGNANIDLTGTRFRIAETFIVDGYGAHGSATYSRDDQVVDLGGRGYCGWINPSPSRVNPFNSNGGPDLDLAFVGYPNLAIDGCDTATPDLVLPGGTNFGDLVRRCAESAADSAEFADCVGKLADQWRSLDLITDDQCASTARCAESALLPLDTPVPSPASITVPSRTPMASGSSTVTPTAEAKRTATPTSRPNWQPRRREIRLEPATAHPRQSVTAHLHGDGQRRGCISGAPTATASRIPFKAIVAAS